MGNFKVILLIFGIISFIVLNSGNKTTVAGAEQDLLTLASVLQDKDIVINEWYSYSREALADVRTEDAYKQIASELAAEFSGWSWEEQDTGATHSLIATLESEEWTETIKLIASGEPGRFDTYLMYEVRGQSWNKRSAAFLAKEWQIRKFDIFRENATTFSCIKGIVNDKIGSSLPNEMSRMMAAFQAKELETLKEGSFFSTTAHSPLLSGQLTDEFEMNLQIGLRKTNDLGGKTAIVVGTPIITIEY